MLRLMMTTAMGKHENGYARVARDFYPTPSWVVDALAEHVELRGRRIWEPAAGDGRMARTLALHGARVFSSDIEPHANLGTRVVIVWDRAA